MGLFTLAKALRRNGQAEKRAGYSHNTRGAMRRRCRSSCRNRFRAMANSIRERFPSAPLPLSPRRARRFRKQCLRLTRYHRSGTPRNDTPRLRGPGIDPRKSSLPDAPCRLLVSVIQQIAESHQCRVGSSPTCRSRTGRTFFGTHCLSTYRGAAFGLECFLKRIRRQQINIPVNARTAGARPTTLQTI